MEKYFDVRATGNLVRCKIYCNDLKHIETAIIYGHGFGGHKDNKAAERFASRVLKRNQNAAVITFNWPGHGDDTHSKLSLEKCSEYLRAVTAYAKDNLKTKDVFGYATSFGGYLFLRYIAESENPFKKLALRCPAVKMYSVMRNTIIAEADYSLIEKGKNVSIGFDRKVEISSKFISELKESDIAKNDYTKYADRILILHGTKDEIVPFEDVKKFAEENRIEFIGVEDADHRFMDPKKMDMAIAEIIRVFELK